MYQNVQPKMRFYKIVVDVNDGRIIREMYAHSVYHAIDLLYYREEMRKIQENRLKYKLLK
jgi:hypothetical protein